MKIVVLLLMFLGSRMAMADWTCNIGIWNGEGDTEQLARDNLEDNCIVGSTDNSQGCTIMAEGANCQEQDSVRQDLFVSMLVSAQQSSISPTVAKIVGQLANGVNAQGDSIPFAPGVSTAGDGGAYQGLLNQIAEPLANQNVQASMTCSNLAPAHDYDQCTLMLLSSTYGTETSVHVTVDVSFNNNSVNVLQVDLIQYP